MGNKASPDRRIHPEYDEAIENLNQQCEILKMEPKAYQDILTCINKNSQELLILTNKVSTFENKLEPLLNVIDGLVILGELGNSGAAKGVKKLFAILAAVGLFIASTWYALTHLGGD